MCCRECPFLGASPTFGEQIISVSKIGWRFHKFCNVVKRKKQIKNFLCLKKDRKKITQRSRRLHEGWDKARLILINGGLQVTLPSPNNIIIKSFTCARFMDAFLFKKKGSLTSHHQKTHIETDVCRSVLQDRPPGPENLLRAGLMRAMEQEEARGVSE